MEAGLAQSCRLTLTLFSESRRHSGWCAGLSAQAGLQTGREQREQGRRGGRTGARQVGQTGELRSPGPRTPAVSVSTVSRALTARTATRPRPAPPSTSCATRKGKHLVLGRWRRRCSSLQRSASPHQVH